MSKICYLSTSCASLTKRTNPRRRGRPRVGYSLVSVKSSVIAHHLCDAGGYAFNVTTTAVGRRWLRVTCPSVTVHFRSCPDLTVCSTHWQGHPTSSRLTCHEVGHKPRSTRWFVRRDLSRLDRLCGVFGDAIRTIITATLKPTYRSDIIARDKLRTAFLMHMQAGHVFIHGAIDWILDAANTCWN